LERLGIVKPIHLRGLHYALVSSTSLTKPNGERYRNDADDWEWLQVEASKAARWLGYVAFDRIVDERNAAPIIVVHDGEAPQVELGLGATIEVTVPDLDDIKPTVYLSNFHALQRFHLVLFGEKQSIHEVAAPLCRRYEADLYLPSGELTDTQLHTMAKTGAADGRPMTVFVVADFDPSGRQMSISIGRKLQAFKDLLYADLEFEVIPIALTEEQVRELALPSTPLKETERRGDRWRAEFGLEQTEIDALATLKPRELREIIVDAFDRYFDHDLEERVSETRADWLASAQGALDEAIDEDLINALHAEAEAKLAGIREEVERINEQLRASTEHLGVTLPPLPLPPEPELPYRGGLPPLVSTAWPWAEQTRALKSRKAYGNGGAEP
jgi:hypothetical protein